MDTLARGMSASGAFGHGTDPDESIANASKADVGAGPGGAADVTGIVDLSDDHPVAIEYDDIRDVNFNPNPEDDFGKSLLHSPDDTVECTSCHNPMMGVRQALPSADMAKYYRGSRQLQINVGGYRAGSTGGAQSYKDANWQLRHYYEPGMTW